jgi:hypothetical protein
MTKVGSARIDENGNAVHGRAGDQIGKEVAIEPYYNHRLGWYMLRAKDSDKARKIGLAMTEACLNDNIGYDQSGRYDVIECLKIYGRLAKINKPTEADCSSLVRACCIQAGINVGDFNTASEVAVLEKTGAFNKAIAVTPNTKLQVGDILVTRTKGHTVIVTEMDYKPETQSKPKPGGKTKKSVEEVAREVINGKWGVNPERKDRLIKAGYNYLEIQAAVNKLMGK